MIRKGDTVVVIRGEDKGKSGRVLSVDPKKRVVVVQRVRLVQRHQKPGRSTQIKQGTVEKELPIPISAVALIDPKSDKPTRVRADMDHGGEADKKEIRRGKVRLSVRSGVEIEKPAVKS
jgi:large subunit ribosomal protein L24